MANSLGALVVRLGLDATDFVTGMTRSEREAQKLANRISRDLETGARATAVAIGAIVTAAGAALVAVDKLAKRAADFQDLAEETNASAEAIASYAVAAAVAGVETNSVAGAMNKLTKNLVGVDDESKAAGAALKALGINVEEFKRLDPAAQYEAVGKALAGFEDGAAKTAVAMALFGKSGAEQLKVFKALEEAGGRQIILTAEQIRQADEYADKQARVKAELSLYLQALSTQALPVLTAFTGALTDAAKGLVDTDEAAKRVKGNGIEEWARKAAMAVAFVADAADGATRFFDLWGKKIGAVGAAAAAVATGEFALARRIMNEFDADRERILMAPLFSERLAQRLAAIGNGGAGLTTGDFARMDRRGQRPVLRFDGTTSTRALAERQTEAERYLENLQRQLDRTRDLTVEETLLAEIQSGRLKITGNVTEEQLRQAARRIDQVKEEIEVQKLRRDIAVEAGEAINRRNEEYTRQLDRLLAMGPAAKLEEQRKAMLLLADAMLKGRITAEQFNDAATGFLGLNEQLEKGRTLAEDLGMTFASAFEDAIVQGRKLSEIVRALEQDIIRMVTRKLVTEPLANALGDFLKGFGGGGGGGGGFFSNLISSIFGGGRATGGPVDSGRMYRVNESGPELLDVNGRQFLMMGSQRGRVTPLGAGGAQTIIVQVQMPQGATRATGQQFGLEISRQLSRASTRNG